MIGALKHTYSLVNKFHYKSVSQGSNPARSQRFYSERTHPVLLTVAKTKTKPPANNLVIHMRFKKP